MLILVISSNQTEHLVHEEQAWLSDPQIFTLREGVASCEVTDLLMPGVHQVPGLWAE